MARSAHISTGHSVRAQGLRPQQALMFPPQYPDASSVVEKKGVVYTKDWVVRLILDLVGYTSDGNLVDRLAIEPAAGEGAFLVEMVRRLVQSCLDQNRPLTDCESSLIALELDEASSEAARLAVAKALQSLGVPLRTSQDLACHWIRTGDYLFESFDLPHADIVVGNPPYVRIEDIPEQVAGIYRGCYPTMMGRADLYVAFFEAGLRQLKEGGRCGFICADRWMLNQYGSELRKLVTEAYAVDTIIEMHHANPFRDDVSAYPAITILRRGEQRKVVVATANEEAELQNPETLAEAIQRCRSGAGHPVAGLSMTAVNSWFSNSAPWPCGSPKRIAVLRRIEEQFGPLETESHLTKVGIGVATGLDEVFITARSDLVEESRLLPLALARDTLSGRLQWSGHYLVDPWDASDLVELSQYPRLKAYFESHQHLLRKRHTARKNSRGWYRTIDRVVHPLTKKWKLYIPDIKDRFNPVLDRGETYPHHNLYYIQSDEWDLEVLGGLLLSSVAQLFIESYGVKMRGGYLRFQAQYLRRIRIPSPRAIPEDKKAMLRKAFDARDRRMATAVALDLYGIKDWELEATDGR